MIPQAFGRAALVVTLALSFVVGTTPEGTPFGRAPVAAAPSSRPNIVLVFTDDFPDRPPRLWSRTGRTPTLAKFASEGLVFRNAHASTPLCGPSRANVLTGRYGHHTGVTRNAMGNIDFRHTVNSKLQRAGYVTGFYGKHMNQLATRYPTRSAVLGGPARGWTHFDVIWHDQGRFYAWRQFSKDGARAYGRGANDHSTYVSAQAASRDIRNAPARKPIFMVLSLYDGHEPREPMRRFDGHRKCRRVPPYRGPAFNEADASDKPAYIRNAPRLQRDDRPLRKWCEEMMTIDFATREVWNALKDTGRLGDTLFIINADNGWMLGDHRLHSKQHVYSTEVLLVMRWPQVLRNRKRVVTEPVSNVDFARTFCKLAGCKMPRSDGRSLTPLIYGTKDRLDREFIYTEMLHGATDFNGRGIGRPAWRSIISTKRSTCAPLHRYVEYQRGERKRGDVELYDLEADPDYLRSLHRKQRFDEIEACLRRQMYEQVIRPDQVWYRAKLRRP